MCACVGGVLCMGRMPSGSSVALLSPLGLLSPLRSGPVPDPRR